MATLSLSMGATWLAWVDKLPCVQADYTPAQPSQVLAVECGSNYAI